MTIQSKFWAKKTVGCQTQANPPITKVTERTNSCKFRLILRLLLRDVIHNDVTIGANQSPSLNGLFGINFILKRKAQQKLRHVMSGAWQL